MLSEVRFLIQNACYKSERKFYMRGKIIAVFMMLGASAALGAHCQMPCGVYHDEIVYDRLDQYVETMHKAISEMQVLKFDTPAEKNQYVRWIMQKERQSDEVSNLIVSYFLQQKIKPGEPDTTVKVVAAHKLLFLIVSIKQNVNLQLLYEFLDEWNKFKHMFHREGYECKIEQMKLKKWEEEANQLKKKEAEEKDKNSSSTTK